ncbi:hypothetical protein [Streptomyces sp. H27-S2]|nr:hypothetical protein [Streptomyces sp. H27-S2]MCY0953176.1 hypothetical protein [Streptomyces sp. H27-S2]
MSGTEKGKAHAEQSEGKATGEAKGMGKAMGKAKGKDKDTFGC